MTTETTTEPISVHVHGDWPISAANDQPYPRMMLATNVAQFLLHLGGLVTDQRHFEQYPDRLTVEWTWIMPRHTFGLTTPIYRSPQTGTRGLLAALLEHMPRWMPPATVVVTATAYGRTYTETYDATRDGDPWAYAADLIAALN